MDSRVRRIILRYSTLPEDCATDFWHENYGFRFKPGPPYRAGSAPRYEGYDESTFTSEPQKYFEYFYSQCEEYKESTTGGKKFGNLRLPRSFMSQPYQNSFEKGWLESTKNDHNRRFSEVIFKFILRAYFERGILIDIPLVMVKMYNLTGNFFLTRDDIPLVKLGFSPEKISDFLSAFIYEISYHGGSINLDAVKKIFDVETDGYFPTSISEDRHADFIDAGEEKPEGYFSSFVRFVSGEKEGVTEERSHQVEEDKLKSGKLPAIFDGTLDRDAMARALDAAMEQKGLSVRRAADVAGTSAGIISSVRDQRASLDKAVEVLEKLGFVAEISVRPKDPS